MRDQLREKQQERETPIERGSRRAVGVPASAPHSARREMEAAQTLAPRMDGAALRRRAEQPTVERSPVVSPERSAAASHPHRGDAASPLNNSRSDRELAQFQAEASALRTNEPIKFLAVERELERLRTVSKLDDPRQVRNEIQRHSALLADELDGGTAARLYTRTLALTELLSERARLSTSDRAETVREAAIFREPATTQPFPVQRAFTAAERPADAPARPLPVLTDFQDRRSRVHEGGHEEGDASLSPRDAQLRHGVQRLELSPSPLKRVIDELDTEPVTGRNFPSDTSDVFQPIHGAAPSAGRVRSSSSQRDVRAETTKVEVRPVLHATATVDRSPVPMHSDPRAAREETTRPMALAIAPAELRYSDERRLRDNARERELLRAAARSERAYYDLREDDPERAVRVMALVSVFQFSPELNARGQTLDAVLVDHARAWQRRAGEKDESLWPSQEDNVMALGVLAHQKLADQLAVSRVAREELSKEAREIVGPARDALRKGLRELLSREGSMDAAFCRREMLRAVDAGEGGRDDARLFALALDAYPHRPFTTPRDDDPSAALSRKGALHVDERPTDVSARDIERLTGELVALRAAHALREILPTGAERAERVAKVLSSVKDRTAPSISGATVGHAGDL